MLKNMYGDRKASFAVLAGIYILAGVGGVLLYQHLPYSYWLNLLLSDIADEADMVILPGGMPGTTNLKESSEVRNMVQKYYDAGKYIAAICAAPTVFGDIGLLNGKKATCYPGLEAGLNGAMWPGEGESVVVDGNIITSRGVGTAIDFALKLIEILIDEDKADSIGASVVYKR